MMNAFSRTLRLMADLPLTGTVAARQALIRLAGFSHLSHELNWEGSAITFCSGLLDTLHRRGRADLLGFLNGLIDLGEQIGAERTSQLLGLREEMAAISDVEWPLLSQLPPRVFITHNLTAGKEVVETLGEGLEGEGYEVVCEPGSPGDATYWRLRLIRRLGACRGAVIVLGGGGGGL